MELTGGTPIASLIEALRDLRNPLLLAELAVIAGALALGALAAWWVNRRSAATPTSWAVGKGGLLRIVFPVVALLMVLSARRFMLDQGAHPLLDLAAPLLGSLALVRLAIYIVRRVFPPNAALKASERFIAYSIWSLMALYIVGVTALRRLTHHAASAPRASALAITASSVSRSGLRRSRSASMRLANSVPPVSSMAVDLTFRYSKWIPCFQCRCQFS